MPDAVRVHYEQGSSEQVTCGGGNRSAHTMRWCNSVTETNTMEEIFSEGPFWLESQMKNHNSIVARRIVARRQYSRREGLVGTNGEADGRIEVPSLSITITGGDVMAEAGYDPTNLVLIINAWRGPRQGLLLLSVHAKQTEDFPLEAGPHHSSEYSTVNAQ